LVVVPEQYSLATQTELVSLSEDHGILNIDVLSFSRLAHRINDEVGSFETDITMLDDAGKNLIIRMLSGSLKDELAVFKNDLDKPGYIDSIKSVISEFMQYGISVEKAFDMAGSAGKNGQGRLSEKLYDIARLYGAFKEYIKDRYTTVEETLERVSRLVPKSETIRNSVIVFDNFTGFTPVQNKLIGVLMEYANSVHVALLLEDCIQENEQKRQIQEHELFYLSKHTMDQLGRMADERHVVIDDPYKADNTALGNACNSNSPTAYINRTDPFGLNNTSVHIFKGRDPREEMQMVIDRISDLVRNSAYRYRDVAVLAGDIECYRHLVEREFSSAGIPFFIDSTQAVLLNPFIEYIRSFLSVFSENYSLSAVFSFLKSGLSGFDNEEVWKLENYCLAANIKGYAKWHERFYLHTRASGDEELLLLNDIRERFILKCSIFTDALSSDKKINAGTKFPVRRLVEALYTVIVSDNIEERLKEAAKSFEEKGMRENAARYDSIYVMIMNILEELCDLISDEQTDIRGFLSLLDAGLDQIRIGCVPMGWDYVQVGDLTRTRLSDVKALFIIGANDGSIPKPPTKNAILNDSEREYLTGADDDLVLAPTAREDIYTQQLYVYMAVNRPTEHLFVSYASVSSSGTSLLPSYLIRKLQNADKKLIVEKMSDERISYAGPSDAFRDLCDLLGSALCGTLPEKNYKKLRSLIKYFAKEEQYMPRLRRVIENAALSAKGSENDSIGAALAHVLYGKKIASSITRLENYAKCAYRYFLQYGLKLHEQEIFSLEAKDIGNIFHDSMKEYSCLMAENHMEWGDVTEKDRDLLMDEAVSRVITQYRQEKLSSSARYSYMEDRIRRIMKKSAEIINLQVKKGDFSPEYFEIDFDTLESLDAISVKLSDDEIMRLRGRIDRVDTCHTDDGIYVRVIDYKSSERGMDLAAVYEGRQLQLLVYLNAAVEMERAKIRAEGGKEHVIPAGVFYYHIDDPTIAAKSELTDEDIKTLIMKEQSLKGLVNSDMEVLRLMDNEIESQPTVLPVMITSKGVPRSNNTMVSPDDLNVLSGYVNTVICRMGLDISQGDIAIPKPDNDTRFTGPDCSFCPYTSVCAQKPANNATIFAKGKRSNSEWIEMMRQKSGGKTDEADE
ncbi:MAG: exodeoxyribonuclease V subunit gamma, partial [Lachnospiraceae bacterium]|nr:exodeoxyribonuclease V subunit gamma [Lachnospiraceae bacterium]